MSPYVVPQSKKKKNISDIKTAVKKYSNKKNCPVFRNILVECTLLVNVNFAFENSNIANAINVNQRRCI